MKEVSNLSLPLTFPCVVVLFSWFKRAIFLYSFPLSQGSGKWRQPPESRHRSPPPYCVADLDQDGDVEACGYQVVRIVESGSKALCYPPPGRFIFCAFFRRCPAIGIRTKCVISFLKVVTIYPPSVEYFFILAVSIAVSDSNNLN